MSIDSVASWRPVSFRWFGHRAEPYLHERLWGFPAVLDTPCPDAEGYVAQGGFAADGTPVARRIVAPDGAIERSDFTERRAGEIVAVLEDGCVATTVLDERARPIRTTYSGSTVGEELYHWDGDQLVAIDELDMLWSTGDSDRLETGGRLELTHDGTGLARITGAGGVVWQRPAVSWTERLAAAAAQIADAGVAATRHACAEHAVAAGTEVFALMLVYVDQGSLDVQLCFGLEEDRRAWLDEDLDGEELACNLWYVNADHEGLNFVDAELISEEEGRALLRDAACGQPGDPYRVTLEAVARRLARADWSGIVTPTHDFVVYVAEHDEGFGPKAQSVRAVNPPERVAAWDASWPADAPRDDGEF